MPYAIVYDSETTGIPIWQIPSEDPSQPHIVELAAALVDLETREVVDCLDLLVKPDGWVIPDEVAAIHGITTEYALAEGSVSEEAAVLAFIELWKRADLRVAHEATFDDRIIRIALKRFGHEDLAETFKAGEKFCTCWEAKPICAIPTGKGKATKKPTLGEAYQHFFNEPLVGAHRATPDMEACLRIFFAIRDHQALPSAPRTPAPAGGVSEYVGG